MSPDESLSAAGKALRKAREQRDLTVESVASESGIPAENLTEHEAGTAEATLLEVCALAKVLGMTASDIFAEAEI